MKQEDDGPNFTLANNFPRTVRWGGKKDKDGVRADEKGEQEAAPQVEAAEEMGSEVEEGEDRGMFDLRWQLVSWPANAIRRLC